MLLGASSRCCPAFETFRDYRYSSSVSTSFSKHAEQFCKDQEKNLQSGDFILEIACNDGYLLKNFLNSDFKILGIEPAENIASKARDIGIPVISEFFGAELAKKILAEHGFPKLIVANNVLAHVPDIRDFMQGISILSNNETQISIENPSILNILIDNQFDTIYHEHYSYLSCLSVERIANDNGLFLIDLDKLETHGGSNRYWLQKNQTKKSEVLMKETSLEMQAGINTDIAWGKASVRLQETLSELRVWLNSIKLRGETVAGYGAAAKASTLLNAAGIEKSLLPIICDLSAEKYGRYMPSSNYRIVSFSELIDVKPDHILIFPWNIAGEIYKMVSPELAKSKFWRMIPKFMSVSS